MFKEIKGRNIYWPHFIKGWWRRKRGGGGGNAVYVELVVVVDGVNYISYSYSLQLMKEKRCRLLRGKVSY